MKKTNTNGTYKLEANIKLNREFFDTLEEAQEAAVKERECYLAHTAKSDIEKNAKEMEGIYIIEVDTDELVDIYALY